MGGHLNFDGDKLKTDIQTLFQKVFSQQSIARANRKIYSEVQVTAYSGWNIAVPFSFWPNLMVGQTKIIFRNSFLGNFQKVNMPSKF